MKRRRHVSKTGPRLAFERCEARWTRAADFAGEGGFVEVSPELSVRAGYFLNVGDWTLRQTAADAAAVEGGARILVATPLALERPGAAYNALSVVSTRPHSSGMVSVVHESFAFSAVSCATAALHGTSLVGSLTNKPGFICVEADLANAEGIPLADEGFATTVLPGLSATPSTSDPPSPKAFERTLSSDVSSSQSPSMLAQRQQMLAAALEGGGREPSPRVQPLRNPTGHSGPVGEMRAHQACDEGGTVDVDRAMAVRARPLPLRDTGVPALSTAAFESPRKTGPAGTRSEAVGPAEVARAIVITPARVVPVRGDRRTHSSASALDSRLIEEGTLDPVAVVSNRPQTSDPALPASATVVALSRWSLSATAMAALVWAASRFPSAQAPVGDRLRIGRHGDRCEPLAVRRISRRSA